MHIVVDKSGSKWLVLGRLPKRENGVLAAPLAGFQKRRFAVLLCDAAALASAILGIAWILFPQHVHIQSFPITMLLLVLTGRAIRFQSIPAPQAVAKERIGPALQTHLGLIAIIIICCLLQIGFSLRQIFA
ncbi:hypothetical protein [Janthinobacterium fluminis]|uniref:Uncharacterized protein n=1 Tax=Janthinobacterium fluminis TaxID=2987524 RepID=A0ABT5JY39_9BURK|nr:hypothetical protein [Janthinobacterium fluminis]MDC8757350.1 hypothetical protein [Janthinobacterium fluminis]